jgi:nucleotide-binding universal stress UspA family protein
MASGPVECETGVQTPTPDEPMRIVIALKPDGDSDWIDAALGLLPLPDALDVLLLSAIHIPRPPLTSPGGNARRLYWAALGAMRADAEDAVRCLTETVRRRLALRGARVAVRMVTARPAAAIVAAAAAWGADLILTGSPSRGALGRAILGSVSVDVVRMASCPVLVTGRPAGQVQRVLVATDGSVHAEAALRFLAGLPVRLPPEVRVCAVAELAHPGWVARFLDRWRRRRAVPPHAEQQNRIALRSLARAQDILGGLACPIQTSLRVGDVRRELADELERWAPDLLVFGARGRTAGPDVALGSVAETLLARMACPSLVVRA